MSQKALNSSTEMESPKKVIFDGYTTEYDFYHKRPLKHYTNVSEALTWDIPKDQFKRTS